MNVIRWNGEPITKPGVYSHVPLSTYHSQALCDGPSISSSGLRTIFAKSLAHFYAGSDMNPHRKEPAASEALILGSATHHLLLGEADFRKHFTVRPAEVDGEPWQGNRKACKAWLAHVAAEGLTVLTDAQVERIKGMAASLAHEPLIRAGILNGLIEHTMVAKDPETGVWLKARPDAIPTSSSDFSDLKTAADISDDGIERAIGDRGYHQQAALVGEVAQAMQSFSLVFVESDAPHCARVKTLKPCDLELGERQNRLALRMFARALATGRWTGPGGVQTDAEFVEMKPWARTRIEYRLTQIEQELSAA